MEIDKRVDDAQGFGLVHVGIAFLDDFFELLERQMRRVVVANELVAGTAVTVDVASDGKSLTFAIEPGSGNGATITTPVPQPQSA